MPSQNSAFAGTDALLPNGQPNLYSVAGNQMHGERVQTERRMDADWWARHRRVTDLKFQYAVGAVEDKKQIVLPERPRPIKERLSSSSAMALCSVPPIRSPDVGRDTNLNDEALSKIWSTQADYYFWEGRGRKRQMQR
jgi:hypothetical protein